MYSLYWSILKILPFKSRFTFSKFKTSHNRFLASAILSFPHLAKAFAMASFLLSISSFLYNYHLTVKGIVYLTVTLLRLPVFRGDIIAYKYLTHACLPFLTLLVSTAMATGLTNDAYLN